MHSRCPDRSPFTSRRRESSACHNVKPSKSTFGSSSSGETAVLLISFVIRDGALREYTGQPRWLCGNATAEFLYCFAQANKLKKLAAMVKDDPLGEKENWDSFLNALLHDFIYPNYLFSLPMGAGKTYLMAALIYLDLYFARLHPNDPRFARNFVVFAPQASKTAILPSLQTIRNFDPTWVLPASDAAELRRLVHFEILDSPSSKRRDKLHGNNPNLEKVNRLAQTRDFGLVFITNAEKVVMEKLSADDQWVANPKSLFYNEKKAAEVVKTNALREKLSQIPGISVILDEAHHFFSSSGTDEKKLKLAVDVLNQHGHVCAVLGFSGTPYLRHHVPLAGSKVKLSQIQLITYHYSLADGTGGSSRSRASPAGTSPPANLSATPLRLFSGTTTAPIPPGRKAKSPSTAPASRS